MSKKKALLVGVNKHKKSQFDLYGCVNDVHSLHATLQTVYGFDTDHIISLIDEMATRKAILENIELLVSDIDEDDLVVFAFAGHGTQHHDTTNTTVREAIVPYDTSSSTDLIDNVEINSIFRKALDHKNLHNKVNITAIYDCCHSGEMSRVLWLDDQGELDIGYSNRLIDLSELIIGQDRELIMTDDLNVYSACAHEQTAADLRMPNYSINLTQPRGAFSFVFHDILNKNAAMAVEEIEAKVTERVAGIVKHPKKQAPVFAAREDLRGKPIFHQG